MSSIAKLRDVTGFRGEKFVEICLTNFVPPVGYLFRPGFLGDKWPAIDFYVELDGIVGKRPYFFVQTKTTSAKLSIEVDSLRISSTKNDVNRLLQIPGPTYILGVHEPSGRVFAKSVHSGVEAKAITRIELKHELHTTNLQRLYDEVRLFWQISQHKPFISAFA